MSNPDEKDKNRQGSSSRPGTKFMERPGSDTDAGKDTGQFGDEDQPGQGQTTEGQTGEEQQGNSWKYGSPDTQDKNKKTDQDKGQSGRDFQKGGQKQQGSQDGGQKDMGKDE